MKSSIFTTMVCASLMVMAVSCGKEAKKKGNPNNGLTGNFYQGPNLTEQSRAYQVEINNWLVAAEVASLRPYSKVTKSIAAQTSGAYCPGEIKTFLKYFEICVYSSSSGSTNTNGTIVKYLVGVGSINNYVNPISCQTDVYGYNCLPNTQVTYPGKPGNTKLQDAISGRGLALINITRSGTVYTLAYGISPLDQRPGYIYKIDTSLHSIYNPVEVVDLTSAQPTQEYVQF